MTRKKVEQALSRAAEQQSIVDLYRSNLDASYIRCRVLGVGRRLVFLRWEDGFAWDGYALIRLRDIDDLRPADDTPFYQAIFERTRLLCDAPAPDLPLEDWHAALTALLPAQPWVSLECEASGADALAYQLGMLRRVCRANVQLCPLDRTGALQPLVRTPLSQLSCVRWDSRYIAAHAEAFSDAPRT